MSREIAAALGASQRESGYLSGNGLVVAWRVGHLAQISSLASYGEEYQRPAWEVLPLLPNSFQYAVDEGKTDHFNLLKKLLCRPDVTEVVNACDPGREGELIFKFFTKTACRKC